MWKLSKQACKRYQNLSEKEKDKRWRKAHERSQKIFEEEKEKVSILLWM